MRKAAKAGLQHGLQRGLCLRGTDVNTSNQKPVVENCTRQPPHGSALITLIVPISATPSLLLYGAVEAFYRQIKIEERIKFLPFSFSTVVCYV